MIRQNRISSLFHIRLAEDIFGNDLVRTGLNETRLSSNAFIRFGLVLVLLSCTSFVQALLIEKQNAKHQKNHVSRIS